MLAVAEAADPDVRSIMRRAPAWGATTLWIGSGPGPTRVPPTTCSGSTIPDPLVPATGRFVLLYHLLWELTHVCFEHPGLLTEAAECTEEVCITCSDEGRLGEVVAAERRAVRTADGRRGRRDAADRPGAARRPLLVHAGTAISDRRAGR